jgi:AAHS family 4-hydroxybenzoate transporter-like MFS transporter
MAALLPESLSYLVTRGKSPDQALSIATRLDRTLQSRAIRLYARTESMTAVGVSQLFTEGRGTSTMLLWATMFAAFGTTTVIVLLTPTLFRVSGLSLSTAALLVGLHNFVGIAGMAGSGRLIERFGPLTLVPAFVSGAVVLAMLGTVASSATLSAICMTLLALTVLVGASGGIALAATSYPTEIRSTGVGWAMGMARFGQVCSPLIVGLMLRWGWDAARILAVMALLPFLAGAFCGAGRLYERAAPAGKV